MAKHIMLAFVSTVTNVTDPVKYTDLQGADYSAIQTNESAIVYVERMLNKKSDSLSKIFLIVSDTVKNEHVANKNVTHLEYLKQRLLNNEEFSQLKNKFSEQEYSDGNEELGKNILQISKIANAVNDYAQNFSDEKIIVHADMTGGFRHASMLMLLIIQLLKYRGIEIGEILYSDQQKGSVYSVKEIQKVSTLITGADEFVKFGSVEALQEYFEGNPNETTKELLNAMKRFSEAIKICHTSEIKNELKNLGDHIKNFRETANKDVQSELFAKIIDTVESEYGNLIEGNATNLDIIRWCINKGFWQQAMTLCTEWLPLEIVSRKIFVPADRIFIEDAKNEGFNQGRSWQQHFILSYNRQNLQQAKSELVKIFCKDLRLIIKNYQNPFDESKIKDSYGNLKDFFKEYSACREDFFKYSNGEYPSQSFKKKYPQIFDAIEIIFNESPNNTENSKFLSKLKQFEKKHPQISDAIKIISKDISSNAERSKFLSNLKYEDILLRIHSLKSELLLKIFKIDEATAIKSAIEELELVPKEKWSNREELYNAMLKNCIAVSGNSNTEDIFKLLKGYYEIRQERNMLNHANEDEEKDVKRRDIPKLKAMMLDYLDEIEKINVQ